MSRNYHNLTSYYNYYYNAYDSYRNGERRVYKDFKYNYTLPLPMLLFGERGVSDMVSSDMERTLNKCTALLAKHSITVKPKRKNGSLSSKEKEFYNRYEYVRWAQESWLLVGKAHTWKGDLSKAQMAFEYVIRQFPNTTTWYEAQVWLARVEILNGDFISAGDRLKSVDAKRRKPTDRQFNHLLSSTWAFYYLKQHNSNEAIPFIKRAAEFTNYKAERLRYTYLLAQLQQQLGNTTEAIELYDRVMRMGPPYEMAFSIRIQLIALSNMKGEDLKRELLKLASDEKNKDYLDQLYYTLGNMEKQEGNMDKAIEYYLLSARLSTTNDNQKGMSYLVLADHYFQKSEYAKAQAYYDSSFNSLDASFPGYAQLETKTRFLTNLVENLNIVSTEDSLQRVAAMSPKDRDALIASIIGKLQEEEQKLKAQEQADQM
ncbi:MAG: tetratricopeptide repeat protein, partial [Bacteroidales bacterium]|nr:tetratricopeptide repeat protein [Bacteroidales bacterium]